MASNYREPADYFPKELRKKFKLGEYHENATKGKSTTKKTAKKTTKKK